MKGHSVLREHDIGREYDTVRANHDDGPTLCGLVFWRETAQDFSAPHLYIRRGLGAEKDMNGICFIEIFAIHREHFRNMRVRLGQDAPGLCTVRFRCFRSTIWGKILDNTGERRDGLRGNRERSCLRRILIIEQDRWHVEIVSNLICTDDSPDTGLANVHLPEGTR